MRCLPLALAAWLCAAAACAQEPAAPAAPERSGYAFDYPRILAQQRIFGLAHGIALLAAACRAVPATAADSEAVYAAWRARQAPAIAAAAADLSVYYFDNESAAWPALAQKMNLKDALDYAPDSAKLQAACATLPAALQQPRYDLGERLRLEELMARTVAATAVEARERHCRELFPAPLRQLHEARYEVWREINVPVLAQANATLAAAWPADAPAASFDAWYAELRRSSQAGGSLADCVAFSESLKRPEAALRNVFRMPPSHRSANPP
ncbi:MAG: hypothetical protein PHY45_17515 [Rhodocyclaceae bacterium]|nr:hypothetical protein [Rhodocyclaceae bacterium]